MAKETRNGAQLALRVVDLPPVWTVGFIAALWAQSRFAPWPVFGGWADGIGWALIGAGIGLGVAAVATMLTHRTTVIPRKNPAQLVTGGVFGWSRNPIYLGDALIVAGAALVLNAVIGVALAPLFIAVIQKRFILEEEVHIAKQFGETYQAYKRRVRRWL